MYNTTYAYARAIAERQINSGGSPVAATATVAVFGEPIRIERVWFRIVLWVVMYRVHWYQHGRAHVQV